MRVEECCGLLQYSESVSLSCLCSQFAVCWFRCGVEGPVEKGLWESIVCRSIDGEVFFAPVLACAEQVLPCTHRDRQIKAEIRRSSSAGGRPCGGCLPMRACGCFCECTVQHARDSCVTQCNKRPCHSHLNEPFACHSPCIVFDQLSIRSGPQLHPQCMTIL